MGDTRINGLTAITSLNAGDLLPVFSQNNGDARKISVSNLLAYFTQNFASPDFTVETAAPTLTGFTATIVSTTTNVWLILSPTGTMATGTVVFPPAASAFDGQTVLVTTTQQITALAVSSVGATFVGAPTTLGAGASVTFRYNLATLKWFALASTGGEDNVFSQITLTSPADTILDANANPILELSPDYSPPQDPEDINFVHVESGLTSATVRATKSTGTANLNVSAQGGGALIIGLDAGPTTLRGGGVAIETVATTISLEAQGGGDVTVEAGGNIVVDATGTLNLLATGVMTIVGGAGSGIGAMTYVQMTPRTAAQLTTLSTSLGNPEGLIGFCTDSNAAMTAGIGAVLVGGGANNVPVFFDGTNWRIG